MKNCIKGLLIAAVVILVVVGTLYSESIYALVGYPAVGSLAANFIKEW